MHFKYASLILQIKFLIFQVLHESIHSSNFKNKKFITFDDLIEAIIILQQDLKSRFDHFKK